MPSRLLLLLLLLTFGVPHLEVEEGPLMLCFSHGNCVEPQLKPRL